MLTALAVFLIVIFTRHATCFPFTTKNARPWQQIVGSRRTVGPLWVTTTSAVGLILQSPAERQALLEEALDFNQTAAVRLIEEATLLRNINGTAPITTEEYWNDLLTWVDQRGDRSKKSLPWWTKIGALARFSRRARRASLRRVLDLTTPYSSDDADIDIMDDAYRLARRRRSLVVLIRSLAAEATNADVTDKRQYPIIRKLEQQAQQASQSSVISEEDRQNRLPAGLETPKYKVLASRQTVRGMYEIRRYEPFSVCSVSMIQPRPQDSTKTDAKVTYPSMAGASAFGALAGYLFGKNQQETSMKMTTPVISSSNNQQMSFVLPSQYWDDGALRSAPQPLSESGVSLERMEGEERAVIMFGGYASRKNIQLRSKQLLDSLQQDNKWKVDKNASVTVAQYNDPYTPPWKRLNEVSVRVTPK